MKNLNSVCALFAAALFVTVAFGATPVAAIDRNEGDFWTYDVSLIEMGLPISGTLTYKFAGTDTIILGGTEYAVNVMRISGGASQSILFTEVSVAFGGYAYETKDKMAFVENDLYMWMNVSIGSGGFQLVTRVETEMLMTYSPPLLSGFDPGTTGTGDSWIETFTTATTTTAWENGTMQGAPTTDTETTTISFVVDPAMATLTTPAGTFDCLKITATSTSGVVVYYWSDKVGNYVKEEMLNPGSSSPFSTMTLKDYKTSSGLGVILFVAIGGVVLVVALVVLALVVMKKRRPAAPAPYPQPPPPPAQ